MTGISELVRDLAYARKVEAEEKANLDTINAEIQEKYGAILERASRYLATAKEDVASAESRLQEAEAISERDRQLREDISDYKNTVLSGLMG